jgi:hypothetical protein
MEQVEAMQQLSFGWEGRVASMMVGGAGRQGNLGGRGFNFRSAVLGGVWNPHMGASADQLPGALDFARWGKVGLPSRLAGTQGPFPGAGGSDWGVYGLPGLPGSSGGAFDQGWGWGTPGEQAPDAGGGDKQLNASGGQRIFLTGQVQLVWPDGSPAGTIGSSNMRAAGGGDWRVGMDDYPWTGGIRGAASQG